MNWRPAYVALGSNLDQPARQVEAALGMLAAIPATLLVLRSRLWKTRPMGPQDQPDFINAVAGLLTQLDAQALLDALATIERGMGRIAPPVRWGPRVIDLDLLLLGDETCGEPGLTLPHPGLHQRNFVLYPLAEIAADLWVPGHGRVAALRSKVPGEGLEAISAGIR
ncbi:MAG TPA: 2-amino-4-hydroxy-6-hydroxymethyldihydropteridine diphosphokinase [Steroidobacteraceae bacterium]|nr:2-amino-4-hydroxy-6-hydroxymethyldihydropteridine diphosphokinase [Steroidobacteraceae bacterium]